MVYGNGLGLTYLSFRIKVRFGFGTKDWNLGYGFRLTAKLLMVK